jgi:glycerol-3-phosphate acyltransferase PlsY
VAVWVAKAIVPENDLVHLLAPIAAILGHNYSVFLISRDEDGKLRFHGGAGGATALGGAIGLWGWMFPIAFTMGALVFFTLGIASVTTMVVPLVVIIVFAIRASMGLQESIDIWYGIIAEILLIWALRPNIRKLFTGNERIVKYSLNGWLIARKEQGSKSQK